MQFLSTIPAWCEMSPKENNPPVAEKCSSTGQRPVLLAPKPCPIYMVPAHFPQH